TLTQTLFDFDSYITTTGTFYDTVTAESVLTVDHNPTSLPDIPNLMGTLSSLFEGTAPTYSQFSNTPKIPQMTITSLIPVPTIPFVTGGVQNMEFTYNITLTYTGTN